MKRIYALLALFAYLCMACNKSNPSPVQKEPKLPDQTQKVDSSKLVLKFFGKTSFNTDDWSAAQLNTTYSDSIFVSFPSDDSIQFQYYADHPGSNGSYPVPVRYKRNSIDKYGDSTFPVLNFSIVNTSLTMNWVYGIYCGVYATQNFTGSEK